MWLIWFFLKMLGAGIGLLIGLNSKKFRGASQKNYRDKTCYVSLSKHKGRITGRCAGVEHSGPKFRLVRESSWDTRFKDWGLSTELQTGDRKFDDLVYVVSDNPLLANHLSLSQETRDKIHAVLSGEFHEIECDGERLWISAKGSEDVSDLDFKKVVDLSESMKGMKSESTPMYKEPFFYKAFVTEAVLFAVSGYAFMGFMELVTTRETLMLHWGQQVWLGLGLGLGLFAALISVIRTLFSGSSRGHRIIIESAILLFLSLPIAGILLIEDINIGLDTGPSIRVETTVRSMYSKRHKTKSGHYYTYHARLASSEDDEVELPEEIAVSRSVFNSRSQNTNVELELGKGALGLPWLKSVRWES